MGDDSGERRAAMMSVYHHSLGRQLELRGAPAVLLPPAVRPMPLEAALEIIEGASSRGDDRRREVLWTLLRSAPPPPSLGDPDESRYMPAVRAFAKRCDFDLQQYDERRAAYRKRGTLFAGALVAYANGHDAAFGALREQHANEDNAGVGLEAAAENRYAPLAPQAYLNALPLSGTRRTDLANGLLKLEDEVGMRLPSFVNELADATAFSEGFGGLPSTGLVVYPTAAVIVQDVPTLRVSVTATTFVHADSLDAIVTVIDPQNWDKWGEAFKRVRYVTETADGDYEDLAKRPEPGRPLDESMLLREEVEFRSGQSSTVIAEFDNVLSVLLTRDDDNHRADLTFRLWSSISSRYLWDGRPGGILVDEGFTKVRPLLPQTEREKYADYAPTADVWRVTVNKVLRFADRTPASWDDTPLQFGKSLCYLAPAALTWWLQSDIYNAAREGANGTG